MDDSLFLLFAVLFLVVMIFFSNRRRKKAADELQKRVVKGAQIMLTSGIYGKVLEVEGAKIKIETAPKQFLVVAAGAVRSIEEDPKPVKPVAKKTSTSSKKAK